MLFLRFSLIDLAAIKALSVLEVVKYQIQCKLLTLLPGAYVTCTRGKPKPFLIVSSQSNHFDLSVRNYIPVPMVHVYIGSYVVTASLMEIKSGRGTACTPV